jgi:tetratricopeptide (TPR) repeat protein
VKRIFVLGGTQAARLGYPPCLPGVEVINCGAQGAGAAEAAAQLESALRHSPDLVVMLAGARPVPEQNWLVKKYYSLRYGGSAARAAALYRLSAMLARMEAAAGKAKVPLVLATLPSNLQAPPSGALPPEDEPFAEGVLSMGRKNYAAAAALFRKETAGGRGGLYARFWLARALEAAGDAAGAKREYEQVMADDSWGTRPSAAGNAVIRRAASGGVALCDLEQAFDSVSKDGMTGFREFSGPLLWRPAYDAFVWGEIEAAAARTGVLSPGKRSAAPPAGALSAGEAGEAAAAVAASLKGRYGSGLPFFSEAALARLAFLEKTGGVPSVPGLGGRALGVFLAHQAEAEMRSGDQRAALALEKKAAALLPGEPELRLLKAVCLLAAGRLAEGKRTLAGFYFDPARRSRALAAARVYGLIKPGEPFPSVPARDAAASVELADEAVKKIFNGDKAGAEKLLAGALRLDPLNAEALMDLCTLKSASGAPEAALETCAAAPGAAAAFSPVYGDSLAADALYSGSVILLRLGRPEAACEYLHFAISAGPANWKGRAAAEAGLRETAACRP